MKSNLFLPKKPKNVSGEIFISGSKSESNRLLILNALFDHSLAIQNLSNSDDTQVLEAALVSNSPMINVQHAGTAMRFLTAYYAIQEGKTVLLGGSPQLRKRPIRILVDALRSLGAEINYLEKEGFPPLQITGKELVKDHVSLDANVSSQFITALLLIAAKLPNGLKIELKGKITSFPYLMMSVELMRKLGIKVEQEDNIFTVFPKDTIESQIIEVESDWSSASYFYSLAAIADTADIKISSYQANSLQGDSQVQAIYKQYFGVESHFNQNQIQLIKKENIKSEFIALDLNQTPDIAQTLAVSCAALKIKCKFTGLETLKVKETDRLVALQNELKKIGAIAEITNHSIEIIDFIETKELAQIETYEDHRMALSFAPYCLLNDIEIINSEVINKSYPNFWEDLSSLNFE